MTTRLLIAAVCSLFVAGLAGCGSKRSHTQDQDGGTDPDGSTQPDAAGQGDGGADAAPDGGTTTWPEYTTNPFVIQMNIPTMEGRGGIIVHDMDGDGLLDYLISVKEGDFGPTGTAAIVVYAHDGSELWNRTVDLQINGNAENHGLPGWSGPGIGAGDVDGDGQAEVVHPDTSNNIIIRNGTTGEVERTLPVSLPSGATQLSLVQVVNLRGAGDRDAVCQFDPWSGYQFRGLKGVNLETGEELWTFNSYAGCSHNGFRAADLDGDGLDEVAGATIVDDDGTQANTWTYPAGSFHFDSVFMYDIRPDRPGMEVLMLEEGDNNVGLFNMDEFLWRENHNSQEPQNAAVGEFDTTIAGLESWHRSRYNADQRPWVMDAQGNVISEYVMNDVKPANWSTAGVEMINVIDWTGDVRQLCAAKERHTDGQIAVFDPTTGEFLWVQDEQATRIYVVNVAGDSREEIIVVNATANEIRVYWNDQPNPHAPKPNPWERNNYRRMKQNYNYYSP